MKKRVADIVVDTLVENGVKTCFSVVGGGSMHLNNAFAINNRIERIYNHHEQACAMAAEAYARATGKIAAVCVTSGPGGTNTINGVQGAWVDSIPMIVISGHPRTDTTVLSTGLDIRCRGVQENNITEQVKYITKYAKLISKPSEIKYEITKAIHIAMDGRRGPVWIDIPLDIQGNHIEEDELLEMLPLKYNEINIAKDVNFLENELKTSKRPCILTGSGIRTSDAKDLFDEFIKKVRIPIVGGSLQADICFKEQELYYGMSGSSGPRIGNFILQNADLILVLGNSLSYKQTGFNQEKFAPNAKIIMIDIQKDEAKKPGLHIDKCICVDLKEFFKNVNTTISCIDADGEWISYCNNLKNTFPPFEMLQKENNLSSKDLVPALYWWKEMLEKGKKDAVFALGNSSCIAGILQEGIKYKEQRVLVNYNCGSMGHDIPNAIGAAIGLKKEVICVTGDGSVMMNIQELQTIKHYNLPVKIVVFSNNGYNAIRNTCKNFFDGVYMGCDDSSGVSFPEFKKIADAFGFEYKNCKNVEDVASSIEWLNDTKGSCILEVNERLDEISGPKLASIMKEDGTFETPALHQMTPLLSDDEMRRFMIE